MCKDCMSVCASWQQWIKALLVLAYVLFILVALPWLIIYTTKDGFTRKDQLLLIGGIFVLASLPLSVWHILQHMLHFTKPILQKPIIRILWMVPIYSCNAVIQFILTPFYFSIKIKTWITTYIQLVVMRRIWLENRIRRITFPSNLIYYDWLIRFVCPFAFDTVSWNHFPSAFVLHE